SRASQPWAGGHNPFGIEAQRSGFARISERHLVKPVSAGTAFNLKILRLLNGLHERRVLEDKHFRLFGKGVSGEVLCVRPQVSHVCLFIRPSLDAPKSLGASGHWFEVAMPVV